MKENSEAKKTAINLIVISLKACSESDFFNYISLLIANGFSYAKEHESPIDYLIQILQEFAAQGKKELYYLITQKTIGKLIEHCEKAITSANYKSNYYSNDYEMGYEEKHENYKDHDERMEYDPNYKKKEYRDKEKYRHIQNNFDSQSKTKNKEPLNLKNILNLLQTLIKNCVTPEMIQLKSCPEGNGVDQKILISNEEISLFLSRKWNFMELATENKEILSEILVHLSWESEERSKIIIPVVLGEIYKERFNKKYMSSLEILKTLVFIRDSKLKQRFDYAFISSSVEKRENLIVFIREESRSLPELTIGILSIFSGLFLTEEIAPVAQDFSRKYLDWVPGMLGILSGEVANELQQEIDFIRMQICNVLVEQNIERNIIY